MNSGHPINNRMKRRRKSVGGVQERSDGLGSSAKGSSRSPASLKTSHAQEQAVPNHQRWQRQLICQLFQL